MKKNNSILWHYTKGYNIPSILNQQLIRTERSLLPSNTDDDYDLTRFDFVWATTEDAYPWAAFPSVVNTYTNTRLDLRKSDIDWLAKASRGLFRIGFDISDCRFERWVTTPEYKKRRTGREKKYFLSLMNSAIRKGDDIFQWYIARDHVKLDTFIVQALVIGTQGKQWQSVIAKRGTDLFAKVA